MSTMRVGRQHIHHLRDHGADASRPSRYGLLDKSESGSANSMCTSTSTRIMNCKQQFDQILAEGVMRASAQSKHNRVYWSAIVLLYTSM